MARVGSKFLFWSAAGLAALAATRSWARRSRALDFRGKSVLITGGSRGLGLVLARQLAEEGARVAICARDQEELDRAAQQLDAPQTELLALQCDVTDREQVEQMVRQIEHQWGTFDVLINNAGTIRVGPAETMTLDDYEQAMQIHFWGPLYTTLAVLPGMRRRGSGRIVNIASIGGKMSTPHLLPYCASKFALVGLSEGMRAELAQEGIYVTTVCPGGMRTGSPYNAEFKGQHRAEYTWFSIFDSIPGLSIDARRAAAQIIKACRYGDAEVVLSLPAQIATLVHGVMPGVTADVLALVNRALPASNGSQKAFKGHESHSRWSPSFLTRTTEEAARRNNEI